MKKILNENCINCMYSINTKSSIMINDMMSEINQESNYSKCNHQNSPFYDELVDDNQVCRLFVDSNKYFLQKDRKDKLIEIKDKNR